MNTPSNTDLLLAWTRNAANTFTHALGQRAGVTLPKWDNLALCGDVKPARWLAEGGISNRKTAEQAGARTAAKLICWLVEGETGSADANQVAAYRQLKAEDFARGMLDEQRMIDEVPQDLEDGRFMVQLSDDRGTDFGFVEFRTEAEADEFIDQVLATKDAMKQERAAA